MCFLFLDLLPNELSLSSSPPQTLEGAFVLVLPRHPCPSPLLGAVRVEVCETSVQFPKSKMTEQLSFKPDQNKRRRVFYHKRLWGDGSVSHQKIKGKQNLTPFTSYESTAV